MRIARIAASLWVALVVAQAPMAQEVTEDGLVRVPSSRQVGVYRAPAIPFTQFRSVMIAPIPVIFRKTWLREHYNIKEDRLSQMQGELASAFREELEAEFHEAGYQVVDSPGPGTLRLEPYVLNVNIVAPDASSEQRGHTYIRTGNSMKMVVELRDSSSEVIVGRIISYLQPQEYSIAQFASKVGNYGEARTAFSNTARYTREALNVAKVERDD